MKCFILLAEDNDSLRERYFTVLSNTFGQKVTIDLVENGLKAIEKVKTGNKYDLIIMDVDMPRMDGDEAYNILKSQAETKQIPVLFLTGLRTEQEIEEEGEENILPKPIHFEQLFMKVQKLIPD